MKKYLKNLIYSPLKFLIIFAFTILCTSNPVFANELLNGLPALNVNTNGDKTEYSLPLQILILMGALTILPSLVLGMTSFTRIIIVMSILRQALGTQQTPPNQVIIAISLFLTFFIMSPTLTKIYNEAATPYMNNEVSAEEAVDKASKSIKNFMVKNTRKTDLLMFSDLAGIDKKFENYEEIPFRVVLPAFMTSELKTAFQIGFLIFLPFLVIDMVISSILMSLGMMMLSPMLISLPFKLLLFVLVDGWAMTVGSLVSTFSVGVNMTFDENISMLSLAFYKVIMICGPILGLALAIGLLIGIFQAATSINEMTLSFVPKVIVVLIGIAFLGNFFMVGLSDYFSFIFDQISGVGI